MSAAIQVTGVSKVFKRPLDRSSTLKYRATHPRSSSRYEMFQALHDISFEVPEGQFLGIIGPNGCGKSTLLKILSRIYVADSGLVEVNGKVSAFLELGVGFNPELTARENIFLSGAVLGLTRSELRERAEGILAFAELTQFADMKLKNFSSGMQVRLAFSVAIQAEAGILLMDEVLSVGDARFSEKCFDVFARYKREGKTIVLVTHDLGSVNRYCDRVLHLDHGRLVADGEPRSVTSEYMRMVGMGSDDEAPPLDDDGAQHRWGTREVEITSTRFLDADGAPHHTFFAGRPMSIEVSFAVREQVDSINCGILIDRSDGVRVAGPNLWLDGGRISCPEAGRTGTLVYDIPSLGLLQSSYLVTVALADPMGTHVFDWIDGRSSFRVVDEKGRMGLTDLGGSWRLLEAAAGAPSRRAAAASRHRSSPAAKP